MKCYRDYKAHAFLVTFPCVFSLLFFSRTTALNRGKRGLTDYSCYFHIKLHNEIKESLKCSYWRLKDGKLCLFAFTNLIFLTIFADGHIDVPLVFQVEAVMYFSDSAHLSTGCEVTFTPLNVMNVYVCTCISKLCNTEVSLNVEGTVARSNMQGYQHYCAL